MGGNGIRAAVAGAHGRMGRLAVETLKSASGITFVGGLVRKNTTSHGLEYVNLDRLLADARPQVLVDFTHFPASKEIALACIGAGVRPVIGTSGYGEADIADLRAACERAGVGAVFAPNFAVGAVLMMKFADEAARHFETVEIIEMHETGKKDAPSGTAMATARRLSKIRQFKRPATQLVRAADARGADVDGIGVHSLRLPGVVAHQEIVFGGDAETLTIRHDSYARHSFMSGVLLATRAAAKLDRFVEGLETLL
jgi:4-hydroxy-tetrahydrodipicolinate reductase